MIQPKNFYKLATKEDNLYIHKILGISALINFIYRYYHLIINGNSYLSESQYFNLILLVHTLLSTTSLIFHIPKNRVKGKPMIFPEFRLHSILFAYRSIVCTFLFYYQYHIYYNYAACFLTLIFADIITKYHSSITKTMRNMPYHQSIDDHNIKIINRLYGDMQVSATLFMLGNIETAFAPLFAIQIAAFLMTLVRKNIISANNWHQIYMISLLINIFALLTTTTNIIIGTWIAGHLFVVLRFENRYNKYISWILSWLVYNNIVTHLEFVNNYIIMYDVKYIINLIVLVYFFYTTLPKCKILFINT